MAGVPEAGKCVVIVGVGAVGSQVAEELAHYDIALIRLIDHDVFTEANSFRHALGIEYARDALPWYKAEAMAVYLVQQNPGLQSEAVSRRVDSSVSDAQLDEWLSDGDLIVIATDEREAQRRVGRRALALDVPAIFPGLYEGRGGEVFVQRSPRYPCFFCWDGWRPADQTVRGAAGHNADILDVIALTAKLGVGILDQSSDYVRRFLVAGPGESQPPQLFVINDHATARRRVPRRPGCPSCNVGPAFGSATQNSITEPFPRWPFSPELGGSSLSAPAPASFLPDASTEIFDRLFTKLGILVASLAFAAAPFGIMAIFIPSVKGHEVSLGVDLLGLIVGSGCFIWVLAGIAAVWSAIGNLFTDW